MRSDWDRPHSTSKCLLLPTGPGPSLSSLPVTGAKVHSPAGATVPEMWHLAPTALPFSLGQLAAEPADLQAGRGSLRPPVTVLPSSLPRGQGQPRALSGGAARGLLGARKFPGQSPSLQGRVHQRPRRQASLGTLTGAVGPTGLALRPAVSQARARPACRLWGHRATPACGLSRGRPTFGVSGPHRRRKTCLGPHVEYTVARNHKESPCFR